MSDWKPGDVAVVINRDSRYFGHRVMRCEEPHPDGRAGWSVATTDGLTMSYGLNEVRPLVVLDPDSPDDANRLAKAMVEAAYRHGNYPVSDNGISPLTAAAALNALANPTPHIEEPKGRGATAQDAEGRVWVSWRCGLDAHERPWQLVEMEEEEFRDWSDIDAVRVLSEGVSDD